MAGKLGLEARMTIGELARRGLSRSEIARKLDVTEGSVRYHLRRQADGAVDGRSQQAHQAGAVSDAIECWLGAEGRGARLNLAALRQWLVSEHDYTGSLRGCPRT